jgi:AcrR family transcriptional regulator
LEGLVQEEAGMRRAPQQVRSQQRVESILSAAAGMIGEVGYDGVTTSKLSQRAGISVGSFYQFFSGKEAVFYALGERYLDGMRRKIDAMFPPDAQYAPLAVLVERAVDLLAAGAAEQAPLHDLMESGWISPEMRSVAAAMNAEIEDKIGEILAQRAPDLGPAQRAVAAAVMMHLVKGVLPAVEGRDEQQRAAIVAEFKRLGVLYMRSVIEGDAPPAKDLARA